MVNRLVMGKRAVEEALDNAMNEVANEQIRHEKPSVQTLEDAIKKQVSLLLGSLTFQQGLNDLIRGALIETGIYFSKRLHVLTTGPKIKQPTLDPEILVAAAIRPLIQKLLESDPINNSVAEIGSADPLQISVYDLQLSVRTRKCMNRFGIETLRDLMQFSERELLEKQNFGKASLNELRGKLKIKGLELRKI